MGFGVAHCRIATSAAAPLPLANHTWLECVFVAHSVWGEGRKGGSKGGSKGGRKAGREGEREGRWRKGMGRV